MSSELEKARRALADAVKLNLGGQLVQSDHLKTAFAEVDRLTARLAELERHEASLHKAARAAKMAERAQVIAYLRTGGHVACIYADSIENGEHEGAEVSDG